MIDEELKAILACPACKGDLLFEETRIICPACRKAVTSVWQAGEMDALFCSAHSPNFAALAH